MSLMAITGNLGQGKTLLLIYYRLRNKLIHKRNVFANLPIKFYDGKKLVGKAQLIEDPSEIESLENGAFLGDELWAWLDARNFGKKSNQLLAKILLTSRKKSVQIFYTTQTIDQMEKRVRDITDFEAVPMLLSKKTKCRVTVYQLLRGKRIRILKTFQFRTPELFKMYDTNYIIETKGMV